MYSGLEVSSRKRTDVLDYSTSPTQHTLLFTLITLLGMKVSTVTAALALPLLAVATPNFIAARGGTKTVTVTATPTATTISECNAGAAQCCNSVQSASSDGLLSILTGLLGIVLQGIDANVGIDCSPISVVGIGGGEW